jgi:hypothetical protein
MCNESTCICVMWNGTLPQVKTTAHRTLYTLGPENAVSNMDVRCPRCSDILVSAGLGVPIALGEALGGDWGRVLSCFDTPG